MEPDTAAPLTLDNDVTPIGKPNAIPRSTLKDRVNKGPIVKKVNAVTIPSFTEVK